ncbi:hypothetical protein QBC46DRAFT_404341 [Diplogelasinospora grovesii]|uniref:Uncharacterized protein n=1 Tax=Diplogelasinospora grovesii TaxID=303347 RepID=A0AAN6S7Y6_9PEZI|nr:hypothetical protein QBC46DRAFT_404341 [Diplogelasinospora grovesii]
MAACPSNVPGWEEPVVFGGPADPSLMEWAAPPDVAVVRGDSNVMSDVAREILAGLLPVRKDIATVIADVITLTGSSTDAQALTCEQYLRQTWPATGGHFLRALQGVLRDRAEPAMPRQGRTTYIWPDRTEITISLQDGAFELEASGTAHSIAEIGQQAGWLSSALRPSSNTSRLAFCSPRICRLALESSSHSRTKGSEQNKAAFAFRIETITEREEGNLPIPNGQCWRRFFNKPVIVAGYPIRRRSQLDPGTGLEMDLAMMAALARAPCLATFEGKTLMKGQSAALVPTRRVGNMVIWHLIVNEDGSRVSYHDPRIQLGCLTDLASVEQGRHILG